jgi:hypothetical protein
MNTLMHRLACGLEHLLGLVVGVSLMMAVLTAWPEAAWAADKPDSNGQRVEQVRSVEPFTAITLTGSIDLRLRQADGVSVVVKAEPALAALVETAVDGNQTLHIRLKRGAAVPGSASAMVEVAAPAVRAVAAKGAGLLHIDGLRSPEFTVSLTGAGDVRAQRLQVTDMSLAIVGSGDVQVAGEATRLRVSISGSGDVKASDLRAAEVSVNISGSGDAQVHAERSLAVSIAGSGDVGYSGSPTVSQSVAGSGSVRRR